MKKNKDEELVTMVIRIPRYKKKMIKNIAKAQGRYKADIIRNGIDKELNIGMSNLSYGQVKEYKLLTKYSKHDIM